jgi:hemerythrin-like domain-containing protein
MASEAVQHLVQEHRMFGRILAALGGILASVEAREDVPHADIATLVDYMSELSYIRHEEKEETILLPALARLGLDWESGILPHVRREHRTERYLLRSLRQSALQLSDWSEDDRLHFLSIGRELIDFMKHHLAEEEAELFPAAEKRLTDAADRAIAQEFTSFDRELDRVPDSGTLKARAEAIMARYTA